VADLRIPSGAQAPLTPAQPGARADAVKAAQRAFFNAALTQTQATAPARRQTEEPARAVSTQTMNASSSPAQPGRVLRPGSLLDIKV
jgi:hypothetical protein